MLALRLPEEIERRLAALAKRSGRSKSFYAREAILEHLDDLEAAYLSDEILILSKKPSRVLGIVKNSLPFPRTLETMKDPQFHKTVREALELFAEAMKI